MKKSIYLLLFLCVGSFLEVYGQHSVMNFSDDYIDLNQRSLLIIPFEPFMYQSDINRELYKENNIDSKEICQRFSEGIDQSFRNIFSKKCEVNSFYFLDESRRFQDLSFVFKNRKLEYVEQKQDGAKTDGIKNLFSRKAKEEEKEGIYGGQVVSIEDNTQKYMKAVANKLLIDSLTRQFRSDFILFINQLDIKNIYGSVYEMSNMEYKRKIDLHYTLYSSDGTILSTGISSTKFPSTENDIHHIISTYFPVLAQNIYDDLFHIGLN